MPFTASVFANKLTGLQVSFACTWDDVSKGTGIDSARLKILSDGATSPTGDEVLILSDYFGCEFGWLIEDDAPNPDENVRTMFRVEGGLLSTADRHAIKEFLHLCKSESLLENLLEVRTALEPFRFLPASGTYKAQGKKCAEAVRDYYGLAHNALIPDVFRWLREQGFRVFRRRLSGSAISGLFVDHPAGGRCILINSSEHPYRQRFSAAHEFGHALLDLDRHHNVSTPEDSRGNDLREIRASTFASHLLMPSAYLNGRWTKTEWLQPDAIRKAADDLWVSVPALLSGLKREGIITESERSELRNLQIRLPEVRDPEVPSTLTSQEQRRLNELLELGLHHKYVSRCFEAHRRKLVSWGKLAEMLLVSPVQVPEIGHLFGTRVDFD